MSQDLAHMSSYNSQCPQYVHLPSAQMYQTFDLTAKLSIFSNLVCWGSSSEECFLKKVLISTFPFLSDFSLFFCQLGEHKLPYQIKSISTNYTCIFYITNPPFWYPQLKRTSFLQRCILKVHIFNFLWQFYQLIKKEKFLKLFKERTGKSIPQ